MSPWSITERHLMLPWASIIFFTMSHKAHWLWCIVSNAPLKHKSFQFVFVFVEVCNEPSPSPISNHLPNTTPTKIFFLISVFVWNICWTFNVRNSKPTRVLLLKIFVVVCWTSVVKEAAKLSLNIKSTSPYDPHNKKERTTYNVNI